MQLSKSQREALRLKYGGRCAYCGTELKVLWHADHVKPIHRSRRGNAKVPNRDHHDNLMPSCPPCNNSKHTYSLEFWRKALEDLLNVLTRNSTAYKSALRFGLLNPTPHSIRFHFETYEPPRIRKPLRLPKD